MVAVPEVVGVLEQLRVERRNRFVPLPVRPVPTEVCRVAEHVRTPRVVRERVRAARNAERRAVVVRVGEDHDIVRRTLAQQQMISDLSKFVSVCRRIVRTLEKTYVGGHAGLCDRILDNDLEDAVREVLERRGP